MKVVVILTLALCATLCHQVRSQGPRGEGHSCTPRENPTGCGKGLVCDYTEEKCVKAETCAERYAWFEENKHKIADLEPPSCDSDGNYNLVQCYAQWTGNGQCTCVDRFTGKSVSSGVPLRMKESKKMTCQCMQDKADRFYRYGNMPGMMFNCHQATGDYNPAKCTGSRCNCVTRNGQEIGGYEQSNIGTSDCQCARDKHETGVPFQCKRDGSHYKKQCFGDVCFCVRRLKQNFNSGSQRPGTPGPPGTSEDTC